MGGNPFLRRASVQRTEIAVVSRVPISAATSPPPDIIKILERVAPTSRLVAILSNTPALGVPHAMESATFVTPQPLALRVVKKSWWPNVGR